MSTKGKTPNAQEMAAKLAELKKQKDANAVVVTRQEIRFKELAFEIVKSTLETAGKYLTLCEFIRTEKIEKKCTTKWLIDLGFHKSKASEICKVAALPDKDFSLLRCHEIGWRGALQLGRGNAKEIAEHSEVPPELKQIALEVDAELAKTEAEASSDTAADAAMSDEEKIAKKKAASLEAMNRAAVQILSRAPGQPKKKLRKWNIGNGFKLELTPAPTLVEEKEAKAKAQQPLPADKS